MTGATFGAFGDGVDVDLLADYIGGALDGTPEESAVAARIAGEPAWHAAFEELSGGMAAVGAELGRLAPEPMPAELAARLETLLTTAPPPPQLAAVPDAPVEPDTAQRRARPRTGRRLRWATPIAIAAGVVAFTGFGLDYLAGRSGGGAADKASSGFAETQAREDSGTALAGPAAPIKTLESGTDYTSATLGAEPSAEPLMAPGAGSASGGTPPAPRAASSAPAIKEAPGRAPGAADPLSRLRDQTQLRACLDDIQAENGGSAIVPQSVDFARFEGRPAVVVRFSAANGTWAWASGPSCGTPSGGADTLGSVPVR